MESDKDINKKDQKDRIYNLWIKYTTKVCEMKICGTVKIVCKYQFNVIPTRLMLLMIFIDSQLFC